MVECGTAKQNGKAFRKFLIAFAVLFLVAVLGFKAVRVWSKSGKKDYASKIFRDVPYVAGSGDPYQWLDIYIPKKRKSRPTPAIVWIHGGAWMSGDKNHPPIQPVLERGYVLASLNYRLMPRSTFPCQIEDCKAAIRFLRAHAGRYGIDPLRIGAWGHSAGGHLVALLGTSGDVKELEGKDLGNAEFSSRVQAVAEWAGPSDLLSIAAQAPANCKIDFKSEKSPVRGLLGEHRAPQDYLAASPVQYVSKDDPPFLILHAEDDDVVPVGQAKELDLLLRRFAVPCKCHISPGGGHGLFKPDFVNETMDFFDEKIGKL